MMNSNRVAVLMSSYNGERFIRQQIDSILTQREVEVQLYVRDDGSTDATQDILKEYQDCGQLSWYKGENLRAARSFMDLIHRVDTDAPYIALSDQDDVWLPDKLITAIRALEKLKSNQPALYYGSTHLVDQDLNDLPQPPVTFVSSTMKQSVISSGCTGCTLCMNRPLFDLVRKKQMGLEMIHDLWIHKICVSVGGQLFFDSRPQILYRQHGGNVIGGKSSFGDRLKQHWHTAFGNRCYRSLCCNAVYDVYGEYMPMENRKICELVRDYHKGLNRFRIIFDKGYRLGDKRLDSIFIIAVLLGVF